MTLRVLVLGAGEHASGTAHRLFRCGFHVVMTDIPRPTAVRHAVSFCSAILEGSAEVEGVRAECWELGRASELLACDFSCIPVFVDPDATLKQRWQPDVLVDGRLLKRNLGNSVNDARLVIGLGPGLEAGKDVHLVVETARGHDLGRLIESGLATPDSGIPGAIAGYTTERVLRAPRAGRVEHGRRIGERITRDESVCSVAGEPVPAQIDGVLRGIVWPGTEVDAGFKLGDIDPRGEPSFCFSLSDKTRTLSGAVLEAILSRFQVQFAEPA
jgi:xanthine dehydrogenase accessory factor